jgi:serpin B
VTDLGAWVRGLLGKSQPSSPRRPAPLFAAPLSTPSSALEQKVDDFIAAAEISISQDDLSSLLAEDNNAFAVALHGQLHVRGGNQFYSPFSIRSALLMTYAGARGETAAQMRKVLRASIRDDALFAACASMVRSLKGTLGSCEIVVANSLWSQVGASLEPQFVDLMAKYFGGSWNSVDFRRDAKGARASINHWVRERTRGKISDVIAPGSPNADTRLVVVNAVYFKGKWTTPFDKASTRDEAFYLENGGEVRVPLMHQTESVAYRQGAGFQAVTLPYRGTELSLLVLLPDRRDGLKDLEAGLSAAMIKECVQVRGTRRVEIFLPRFTLTWGTVELRDTLETLGMRLALKPQADFSGINGRTPPDAESLFVSAVLHKAFVDVNEEGTEAAAATAVAMVMRGLPSPPTPVPIFRADHPFLFGICDRNSGALLFLGRMLDPTRHGGSG